MPLEVTPSDQVVISLEQAGPDDFLRLRLEDGACLFLRATQEEEARWRRLTFDEAVLPSGFADASRQAAKRWLSVLEDYKRKELKALYDERQNKDETPLDFVARELRKDVNVDAVESRQDSPKRINIGTTPEVTFGHYVGEIYGPESKVTWTATTSIRSITPVDRFTAEIENLIQQG